MVLMKRAGLTSLGLFYKWWLAEHLKSNLCGLLRGGLRL